MLLSVIEEEDSYGPAVPFSYKDMFVRLFQGACGSGSASASQDGVDLELPAMEPQMPKVDLLQVDGEPQPNETGNTAQWIASDGRPDLGAQVTTTASINLVPMDKLSVNATK